MSDLYVELRSRIPVVTQWVTIGTEKLKEAQAATGLSDERLARKIPVSVKTWYRWKLRGQVPASSLPALARVLPLDLRRSGGQPVPVEFPPATSPGEGEDVVVLLREVLDRLDQLEAVVRSGLPPAAESG